MKHKKVVPNSGQVSVGRRGTVAISLALVTGLSACAAPKPGQQFNDPYEKTNRSVHEFNVALDKHVIRPVAIGYGTVVPSPVRTGISNFSANLSQPSYIVNDLL
ncbi:VacJ family lipoprotein, partial [Thioclava sp. BHET1]